MAHVRFLRVLLAVCLGCPLASVAELRCGAAAVDVSPQKLPVIQNGGFLEALIQRNIDPLHARALVFADGQETLALVVVDSCMIPRDVCDKAKALAAEATGIGRDRVLITATHTHSAPSVMDMCLGSRSDPAYTAFLPGKVAEAIRLAHSNLQPAKIGFASADAGEFTKNRRWVRRSDNRATDPFGEQTVQAMMHPGYRNPDYLGPSGPVDPWLSLVSVRTADDRPLALFANFSMHYFSGHPGASSDYCGRFATEMKRRLAPDDESFVAMMSQGTSGDLWWGDYALPKRRTWDIDEYAGKMAALGEAALRELDYRSDLDLAMKESRITLGRRLPDDRRLEWAKKKIEEMGGNRPRNKPEVYAEQAVWIHENPKEEVVLQAVRIGDIAITGMPNEVYAITGLKLKHASPFPRTINISLANGAAGYIPPPEQHALGGYTTWPARTAGLEVEAEPKILDELTRMLGNLRSEVDSTPSGTRVSTRWKAPPHRDGRDYVGGTRLDELSSRAPHNAENATYRGRLAFAVPGIPTPSHPYSRAVHFAGGHIELHEDSIPAEALDGSDFSVELWFWSGLSNDARHITGFLYSHGNHVLGISGKAAKQPGRLMFGNELGRTEVIPRAWNHLLLTCSQKGSIRIYLNGRPDPEIASERPFERGDGRFPFTIGADRDGNAPFEGRIDELSIFRRAFSPEEVAERFGVFGIAPPTKPEYGEVREPKAKSHSTSPQLENDPLAPHKTIAATHVPEGYVLELVAAEPLVADPVAIDWGPDGKLWVAEMADYPYGMDGKGKPGGRVRYLEDLDGDGSFERSKVVAEGLSFPTSVLAYQNYAIVTAAPDILRVSEDKVPDVLYHGFIQGNQQLRVNSLRWGLDNWIHCASGGHHAGFGKDTVITDGEGHAVELGSRDFRFHPKTGTLEPLSGPSQFGRVRDDWGNWFGVQNSWPLWHYVLSDRYLRRNANFAAPDPRVQVRTPGNPRVYPNKPVQKRFHSFEQAGRYTSACGPSIYRDSLMFSDDENSFTAFTCEPFHNVVQRHRVERDGVSFKGERAEDGERDFFASGDRWCRPVMTRTGPDGALYVVDMYRYMIEHPDWLPPEGREELKPFYREGDDRGRIYRIRKKDVPLREFPDLVSGQEGSRIVENLAHPNGIIRDLVHRTLPMLSEEAVETIIELIRSHSEPRVRLQALCVLDGKDLLPEDVLLRAMSDSSPGVRRNAARISERHTNSEEVVAALISLSRDPDASARLQAILSLGETDSGLAGRALVAAAKNPANRDGFFRAGILSSAPSHLELLAASVADLPMDFAKPLFSLAWGGPRMVALLESVEATVGSTRGFNLLGDFFSVMDERGKVDAHAEPEEAERFSDLVTTVIPRVIAMARDVVPNRTEPVEKRLAAIRVLGRGETLSTNDTLLLLNVLSDATNPESLRIAVLDRLSSIDDQSAFESVFDLFHQLEASMRAAVIGRALQRKPVTERLLDRIKDKSIPAISIPLAHRQALLKSKDAKIRELAGECFQTPASNRKEIAATLARRVEGLKDTGTGAATFRERCASCHSLEENANRLGPDLKSITDRSTDGLLAAIVDPNRAVDPVYVGVTVTLKNGQSFYGKVQSETGASYNLQLIDGSTKGISRESVAEVRLLPASLMPEGLEAGLSAQQVADLLAYVARLGKAQ